MEGTDAQKMQAFYQTLLAIKRRLELLTSLPAASLERLVLEKSARELANA